ncbi:MAG: hypothetical protein AAFX79_09350 [Planctomycetota bacterium]
MGNANIQRRGGVLKKALIALGVMVLVVLILVGRDVVLGLTATPDISEDYGLRLHELALDRQRAALGGGPDEWPAYERAMEAIAAASDEQGQRLRAMDWDPDDPWAVIAFDALYSPPDGGTPEHYAAARRRAAEELDRWEADGIFGHAARIAAIRVAAPPPVSGPLVAADAPYLGPSRAMARAQAARMHRLAERGDLDGVATAFEELIEHGRVLSWQGGLLRYFVALALRSLAYERMAGVILLHGIDDDAWLRRIDALVVRSGETYAPLEFVLEADGMMGLDTIQRSYTSEGRFIPTASAALLGVGPLGGADPPAITNAAWRFFPSRAEAEAMLAEQRRDMLAASELTGDNAARAFAALEVADEARSASASASIVGVLPIQSVAQMPLRDRLQRHGLRVLLAIERYRAQHGGAPPASLGDLGGLLPAGLRNDPVTGEPWSYTPGPGDADAAGQPIPEGAIRWPYELRVELPASFVDQQGWGGSSWRWASRITRHIDPPVYDEPIDDGDGG